MDQTYAKHNSISIAITGSPIPKPPSKNRNTSQTPRKARHHEDIPWTAARCQRLLRTIASRIHILRRLSENDFAEQALRTPKAKRKRDVSVDPVVKLGSQFATLETPSHGDDPEWFPTTEKKVLGKTYAGRGRSRKIQPADAQQDTDVAFKTPYIRRIMRPEAAISPASPVYDAYSTTNRIGQTERKARQDSIQPRTHAERALNTLLQSFDGLLAATNPKVPPRRKGASSLLSMCLRKMPQYIDFEQDYAEEEEEDYSFNAIETIYLALENLGNGSWHGMRELVRSHAVKMIADAMQERMWPLKSLGAFLEMCAEHHAGLECQQLLRVWLLSAKGKVEKPVETFVHYSIKFGYQGFMFRTLAEMLASGDIGCSELCREGALWKELPVALARRSIQAEAAAFLSRYAVTCITIGTTSTNDDDASTANTEIIISVLSLVTSMCLLSNLNDRPHLDLAEQVHRLTVDIVLHQDSSTSNKQKAVRMANLFTTSSLLIQANTNHTDIITTNRAPTSAPINNIIHSIHRTAANTYQSPSTLRSLDAEKASHVLKILKCIDSIDKPAARKLIQTLCPSNAANGDRWQWEETIAEWVAELSRDAITDELQDEHSTDGRDSGIGMSEPESPSIRKQKVEQPVMKPAVEKHKRSTVPSTKPTVLPKNHQPTQKIRTPLAERPNPPIRPAVKFPSKGISSINLPLRPPIPPSTPSRPAARVKKAEARNRTIIPRKRRTPDRDELANTPFTLANKIPLGTPDELGITPSPIKPNANADREQEEEEDVRDELGMTPCRLPCVQPSRDQFDPQLNIETDELAPTPRLIRKPRRATATRVARSTTASSTTASSTTASSRTVVVSTAVARTAVGKKGVVGTPARMTLRSRGREMVEREGGGYGSCDDE